MRLKGTIRTSRNGLTGESKTPVPFQVFLHPDVKQSIAEIAKAEGKTASEYVREVLSSCAENVGERAFAPRLKVLTDDTAKILKRINGLTAIVKSVEDDERERDVKNTRAISDALGQSMVEIGHVIASNSAALVQLAEQQAAFQAAHDAEIASIQQRLEMLLKLTAAVIHGSKDGDIRTSYRTIEAGMKDGTRLTHFLLDALKRA